MIKLEHTVLPSSNQMQFVIEGMRNPMNSWDKSDSGFSLTENGGASWTVGKNDYSLMKKLAKAGKDHRKFMRMLPVYVRITAPLYWWSEYDTYKVGTVANSCSKMHKLLSKPFEMSDFSFDKLLGYKKEIKQFVPEMSEDDVANEFWVSFNNEYDVSSYGRVRHNFKNHYRIISGSIHKDGYRFVTIKGKQYPLHRIVAELFHSDTKKDGLVVNHIDGNKQNNKYTNLEWVTQSDNIKHSYENNLQPKSCGTYKGKFSAEQRQEIKDLWDNGDLSKREIAKRYNVSHTCINDIINDKYKYAENTNVYEEIARPLVDLLNQLRDMWINCEDELKKKEIWYSIIQLLPSSYNQTRNVMLNYEVLANIYKSRKNHKLDEWKEFCKWIEELPFSDLITHNIGEVGSSDNRKDGNE